MDGLSSLLFFASDGSPDLLRELEDLEFEIIFEEEEWVEGIMSDFRFSCDFSEVKLTLPDTCEFVPTPFVFNYK